MSIELTLMHRRSWWHVSSSDHQPEHWEVSADVWDLDICPDSLRHVGDFSLAVVDLRRESALLDSTVLGQWGLDFVSEAVIDHAEGRLHPELETLISPGVPRLVILRRLELTEPWRGYGLGAPLVASALEVFAPTARLAACRVSPHDASHSCPDRESAELFSARVVTLLGGIGFRAWRGAHVIDLRDPTLVDARTEPLRRWYS